MIVCDGCHARGKFNKSNCFMVKIEQTHETYHLCNECVETMKAAVLTPPPIKPEPKTVPAKKAMPKKSPRGKR